MVAPTTTTAAKPTPKTNFQLFDVLFPLPGDAFLANFDAVSGGDITVSFISYKVITPSGHVTLKQMPGHVTYSPFILKRPIDSSSTKLMDLIQAAMEGKIVRKNYSVAMFKLPTQVGGETIPLAWWHLYNALPISVTGLAFTNLMDPTYADISFTFQAERIEFINPGLK